MVITCVAALSTEAIIEVTSGVKLGVGVEVSLDLPAAGLNTTTFFNVIDNAILDFYESKY